MKVFQYLKSNWQEVGPLKGLYLQSLTGKPDGFWDDKVYGALPYQILCDGQPAGFFTIGEYPQWEASMTSFFLKKEYSPYAYRVFGEIFDRFKIDHAFVPSCDEAYLVLTMEKCHELGGSYDMQAYFFWERDGGVPPAKYGADCLSPVLPEELSSMNEMTEGQWEQELKDPRVSFYQLKDNGEILGYGLICTHHLDPQRADIGNFVLPKHRRKGVGRSLIIGLSQLAEQQGLRPAAGCWYKNKESLLTLSSSGFTSPSRLFYFSF